MNSYATNGFMKNPIEYGNRQKIQKLIVHPNSVDGRTACNVRH